MRLKPSVYYCDCGNVAFRTYMDAPVCKRCFDIEQWLYSEKGMLKFKQLHSVNRELNKAGYKKPEITVE